MSQINSGPSSINKIDGLIPKGLDTQKTKDVESGDFQKLLNKQLEASATLKENVADLKFSKHAIERMQSRGISMNTDKLTDLSEAVKKAQEKGAKETLVMMDDAAFVVSVKNNTVITAIDKALMKENVFTNIDSTIFV